MVKIRGRLGIYSIAGAINLSKRSAYFHPHSGFQIVKTKIAAAQNNAIKNVIVTNNFPERRSAGNNK